MARERDSVYSERSLLEVIQIGAEEADGRQARGIRHPLSSMLVILLIGFLFGQIKIREVCRFFSCPDKLEQLRSFLDLPHGIPSPSCFSRTLAVIDPLPIITCYADFLYQLVPHEPGAPQHICADGKALNAAMKKALTGSSFYIINIFNAAYHLFTYQVKVGAKKQEGKVLEQEIYDILFQNPSIVTADAMATKKAIWDLIRQAGSNAALPVKKNNKLLMNFLLETCVPLACEDKTTDHYLDLGGFSEDDTPSAFIDNTVCAVYDEDNRKESEYEATPQESCPENDPVELTSENNSKEITANDNSQEPANKDEQPIETHVFFTGLYPYRECTAEALPGLDPHNRRLFYVRIGNLWVPMVRAHGRFERREYELFTKPALIETLYESRVMDGWENVEAVGLVTRYRGEYKRDPETKKKFIKISVTRTPYIMSFKPESAKQFAEIIKDHWSVEEGHNCLDDLFQEDHSTIRVGNAPETCSLFRKIAYNMISMLDARRQKDSNSSCEKGDQKSFDSSKDNERHFKEIMESLARKGIPEIKKLINHRFRSPYMA